MSLLIFIVWGDEVLVFYSSWSTNYGRSTLLLLVVVAAMVLLLGTTSLANLPAGRAASQRWQCLPVSI